MDLERLYTELKQRIDKVDFTLLWKGFQPLKYALYTDTECFFDGAYIEKTDVFLANTAIEYQGEYIAIWHVSEEEDLDTLASLMIHEMFHAYQMMNHDSRFPAELEALTKYQYSAENLSIKLEENKLIAELVDQFDQERFERLMELRKFRLIHYPYEFRYEAAVEQIEGTANYVELRALKQISQEKYQQSLKCMQMEICKPSSLMPIRIDSYSIGALLFMILKENDLFDFEPFSQMTTAEAVVQNVDAPTMQNKIDKDVVAVIEAYYKRSEEFIQSSLSKNQCVVEGDYELRGVNIYNARYQDGFIVTTYFVMYEENGENKLLQGDFVVKLNKENKVEKIYEM